MADDPVIEIYGIGKVISAALATHGVTTVAQLAELEPGEYSIANLSTLIHRAKEYLKTRKASAELIEAQTAANEPKVTLDGASKPLTKPKSMFTPTVTKVPVATTKPKEPKKEPVVDSEAKEMYLISDHTWYETRVVIPREEALAEAIIYELCIEPNERIAFVCTWVTSDSIASTSSFATAVDSDDKTEKRPADKLHTMTYSPQLLLHFNLDLPPLKVSIREEDFQVLPNQFTLVNVLWEVDMMQRGLKDLP